MRVLPNHLHIYLCSPPSLHCCKIRAKTELLSGLHSSPRLSLPSARLCPLRPSSSPMDEDDKQTLWDLRENSQLLRGASQCFQCPLSPGSHCCALCSWIRWLPTPECFKLQVVLLCGGPEDLGPDTSSADPGPSLLVLSLPGSSILSSKSQAQITSNTAPHLCAFALPCLVWTEPY